MKEVFVAPFVDEDNGVEVVVTHFFVQKPLGKWCDSDWDANGYTELEWDFLDPAIKVSDIERQLIENWLEKEMTAMCEGSDDYFDPTMYWED